MGRQGRSDARTGRSHDGEHTRIRSQQSNGRARYRARRGLHPKQDSVTHMHATTQPPPAAVPHDAPPGAGPSLSAALRSIYLESRELLHDHLRLAALEARSAVRDLVIMIGLALGAALLGVTAWLALVAAAVAWAIDADVSPPVAFLGAAVLS